MLLIHIVDTGQLHQSQRLYLIGLLETFPDHAVIIGYQ